MSDSQTADAAIQEAIRISAEVRQSVNTLLADPHKRAAVTRILNELEDDCRRIHSRRGEEVPTLAIVGKVGQGKSWLLRCFLVTGPETDGIRCRIRTGQHEDTERVLWLGTHRPVGAERDDQHIEVGHHHLINLRGPYLVCDTPGFSEVRAERRQTACFAALAAPVKVFVMSFADLRDRSLVSFFREFNGAVVLPVIRFDPVMGSISDMPTAEDQADVDRALSRWRQAAPDSQVLEVCYMPRERLLEVGDAERIVRERLVQRLAPVIGSVTGIHTAIDTQIRKRAEKAFDMIGEEVSGVLERLQPIVERINDATGHLPSRSLAELVGDEQSLRTALRQQFRSDWIERTGDVCFPYKSFLNLLSITAGAWERLLFSMTGSLPSLALTLVQSVRNIRDAQRFARRFDRNLRRRVETMFQENIQPEVVRLHAAIAEESASDEEEATGRPATSGDHAVTLIGLEDLQDASRALFPQAIARHRAANAVVRGLGALAVAIFWALLGGPLYAIYKSYLVSYGVAVSRLDSGAQFSLPALSLLSGVVTLSAAPVAVIALVSMAWSCRRVRVTLAATDVTRMHQQEIASRMADGRFRVDVSCNQLSAIHVLVKRCAVLRKASG